MNESGQNSGDRTIGLAGATGIGVGAMVGGGILALAGVAFSVSGPSALLAFTLNGVIALITALCFAEMAVTTPKNGGTYTYAKKALNIQMAFGVGWVVWFASLVAAVLYALGFGVFATVALEQILPDRYSWIWENRWGAVGLALAALGFFLSRLLENEGSGGQIVNIGKLAAFVILIAAGLAVAVRTPVAQLSASFEPFFSGGFTGVVAAMGYTFIAFQGFDLIASAAGEVKKPEKTLPKAMIITLGVGMMIYLPLLFIVMTVGLAPGESIMEVGSMYPETVIAVAAEQYMGAFGFWLVIVAGIFSMLSALQANLFAGSRFAMSMSHDHMLSPHLTVQNRNGAPSRAIYLTCGIAGLLILLLPDVAAAGAASSLIFLITFALGQFIMIRMRQRGYGKSDTFQVPWYPFLPAIGLTACLGLAVFQAVV